MLITTAGPDSEEGWLEAEAAPLTAREVREVVAATDQAAGSFGKPGHKFLKDAPASITDCYSSVGGDSFHYIQRPQVSHHK